MSLEEDRAILRDLLASPGWARFAAALAEESSATHVLARCESAFEKSRPGTPDLEMRVRVELSCANATRAMLEWPHRELERLTRIADGPSTATERTLGGHVRRDGSPFQRVPS